MFRLPAACCLGLACLAASVAAADTVELNYEGLLVQKKRGGDDAPVKTFSLLVLLNRDDDGAATDLFWAVDDKGTGWFWPESYGRIDLADANAEANRRPQLLHTHNKTPWPLPLPHLVFMDAKELQSGRRWVEGRFQFEVGDTAKRDGKVTRQVTMSTTFGRSHTLQIDPESGILRSMQQKLFMGQGDEFQLAMQLRSEKTLDADRAQKTAAAVAALISLQQTLDRDAGTTRPELSEQQLADIAGSIDAIEAKAENTPLQGLSVEIHRDLKLQTQRKADLTTLAARYLGKKVPPLKLTDLSGKPLPADATAGKIVVLHFWKYHEDPLIEPYGQVGYLDYLFSRRGKLGVKVIGVAVDSKLANPEASRGVIRAIRKLTEFMNLSYTVVQDSGALIKEFGDPRTNDGGLPLCVVLSPSGEIVHYKVGYYDVKPEEGLVELDRVLVEQIKAKRAADKK